MAKSKFDIVPGVSARKAAQAEAKPGPMSTAIRETAQTLDKAEEDLRQQRKRNAEEARQWRSAMEEGLILLRLPLDLVRAEDLARDRSNLAEELKSPEMEELKQSIRVLGQKEPIAVQQTEEGYSLTSGWRRLNALRMLFEETGEDRFSLVMAKVQVSAHGRMDRYVDMVTENVVRKNLSLAEMAGLAMAVAADPEAGTPDLRAAINRLYHAQSPAQRSYINAFARLLQLLGDSLIDARSLARDLGVQVARALSDDNLAGLRKALDEAEDPSAQQKILRDFVERVERRPDPRGSARSGAAKTEFRMGQAKLTARRGEIRIKAPVDYAEVPREVLEEAWRAFEAVLRGENQG
ncbi:ParB N-terminal domain-containing protein [Mangrovicoccus algicola]|uniref:ParB N-terminal domain-containing protein n=1 Tax=Mangrovicoccus algicola TaxID=2771008 RepID=A0A8J6Z6C4_9RHOB|nr:ParB N-terminal domain-containing protein [Mangrovicoccus algicola]MBE3637235.1 ParB N-terminal domain-containing protein [Mangrovicoccus algicola]